MEGRWARRRARGAEQQPCYWCMQQVLLIASGQGWDGGALGKEASPRC